MLKRSHVVLTLAALLSSAAGAQTPDWVAVLQAAAQLPVSANEARSEGVPDKDVREVLNAMRDKKVRASEARDVLDEARSARREHGPVDNFGAFVQSRLDAGLRGRELAAAIRAEHRAHGKGGNARGADAKAANAKGGNANADRGKAASANAAAKGKSSAADTKGKRPPKNRQEDN
jgi:hypothetical protein